MKSTADTHFWIWRLTPRSPLKSAERNALDAAAEAGGAYLAAISLWEARVRPRTFNRRCR